jgi:hypothetical protein
MFTVGIHFVSIYDMTVPQRQIMPMILGREQYQLKALAYFHIGSGYIFITLLPLNTKVRLWGKILVKKKVGGI